MKIAPDGQEYDLTHEWVQVRADVLEMTVFKFQTRFGRLRVLAENEQEAAILKDCWVISEYKRLSEDDED